MRLIKSAYNFYDSNKFIFNIYAVDQQEFNFV